MTRGHNFMGIGSKQASVLRTVHGGDWFDTGASQGTLQRSCIKLHYRHLLARDPLSATRFTSTPAGDALIEKHDDELMHRMSVKVSLPVDEEPR